MQNITNIQAKEFMEKIVCNLTELLELIHKEVPKDYIIEKRYLHYYSTTLREILNEADQNFDYYELLKYFNRIFPPQFIKVGFYIYREDSYRYTLVNDKLDNLIKEIFDMLDQIYPSV